MGREVSSAAHLMPGTVTVARPRDLHVQLPEDLVKKRDEAIDQVGHLKQFATRLPAIIEVETIVEEKPSIQQAELGELYE